MSAREHLRVIHLDAMGNVLDIVELYGEPHSVPLPFRRIVADILRLDTCGLVLSHTHPGGDPTPSPSDIVATQTLRRAVEPLGVRLHDHVITAADSATRFRALGLL